MKKRERRDQVKYCCKFTFTRFVSRSVSAELLVSGVSFSVVSSRQSRSEIGRTPAAPSVLTRNPRLSCEPDDNDTLKLVHTRPIYLLSPGMLAFWAIPNATNALSTLLAHVSSDVQPFCQSLTYGLATNGEAKSSSSTLRKKERLHSSRALYIVLVNATCSPQCITHTT